MLIFNVTAALLPIKRKPNSFGKNHKNLILPCNELTSSDELTSSFHELTSSSNELAPPLPKILAIKIAVPLSPFSIECMA